MPTPMRLRSAAAAEPTLEARVAALERMREPVPPHRVVVSWCMPVQAAVCLAAVGATVGATVAVFQVLCARYFDSFNHIHS